MLGIIILVVLKVQGLAGQCDPRVERIFNGSEEAPSIVLEIKFTGVKGYWKHLGSLH